MNFNKHYNLEGRHATLSPSQGSWIRYDDDKLATRLVTMRAAQLGTMKHELAQLAIQLGQKMPATSQTLCKYVNDSIGYRMTPEQKLWYSDNCFGTADSLGFRRNLLRIFDLKTGETPVKSDQLEIYAALFCLEYGFKPFEIEYDLRIYQSDEVIRFDVDPVSIAEIMAKIVHFDKLIEEWKREEFA